MQNKGKYNPKIHHRRSIRLKGYDYSQAGAYFITTCIKDRRCLFGEIVNDEMILNQLGNIAYRHWEELPQRYPNVELDVFQIMPNHLHGIIVLTDPTVGAGFTPAQIPPAPTKTIGDIVGAYKSLVANECLEIYKSNNEIMGKFWQRNYYEHIIRNEASYQTIANYVINNPNNWDTDKFFMK